MATVDGFVSQHNVVGHLKAGDLKKEKIVDDYCLGDFGSDDCSFLAISSEWIDIPDDCVNLDKSKLVLLKQKMKDKNINKNCTHEISLSIVVNEGIYVESSIDTSRKKKKRRRRRKKNKSVMIDESKWQVEFIDGVFIPSSLSKMVLDMEVVDSISILSSLQSTTLDVQVHDGLFFPSCNQVDITSSSSPSPIAAVDMTDKLISTCINSSTGVDDSGSNSSSDFNSDASFDYDLYDSQSGISNISRGSSNSNSEIISLQSLKNSVDDWNIRMFNKGSVDKLSSAPRDFYSIEMILKEMVEIRMIFGTKVNILLQSLDNLKFIVLNWGGRKVYRLPRSRFKSKNIDKPFDKYYPLTALEKEFIDYHERYGNRLGVSRRTYNKLQLQYFGELKIMSVNDDISSVNFDIDKSSSSFFSNGNISNDNGYSPHAASNGGGVVDSNNEIIHSGSSSDDSDSTHIEYARHKQADFESQEYQQADSNLISDLNSISGLSCKNTYGRDDGLNNLQNQNQGIKLFQCIQNYIGVIPCDEFIPIIVILNAMNDWQKQFHGEIRIDKTSLQHFELLLLDNTGESSILNINFNVRDEFYPLEYFCDSLLRKYLQYKDQLGSTGQSLKKLKFLFVDNPRSLNFSNSNKNKNTSNNNDNNNNRATKNNNDKNNSTGRHNNGRYFQYSRRRGRKKRHYKMVHKNKLQNVKFKQFGSNDNCFSSCHNRVVQTKLVTARAARCAPNK